MPALVPMRVAPASMKARAEAVSRTPPLALTPSLGPTHSRRRRTSSRVAPPEENPVEVFTI